MFSVSFMSRNHSWDCNVPEVPAVGDKIVRPIEGKVRTFYVHERTWFTSKEACSIAINIQHNKPKGDIR